MNDPELAAGLPASPGYRYADVVGDELFVAGQVPLDGSAELVGPNDPRAQAVSCLDNLRTVIDVHGFSVADIHRLVVYVVGPHQHLLGAWDAVRTWFDGEVPPATLLGVNLLGFTDQLVEIDATIRR
jgi:enamine deaminase RidA (YjgF/YER057c/UK114 family)